MCFVDVCEQRGGRGDIEVCVCSGERMNKGSMYEAVMVDIQTSRHSCQR